MTEKKKNNSPADPRAVFHLKAYLNHNLKRLEHFDSLNIDFKSKTVLEVGAGIGDHTGHLLAKGCSHILTTEGREENLKILKARFETETRVEVKHLNMDAPEELGKMFDIVYCYGLLYHLSKPAEAMAFLARHTKELLVVETCVSYLEEDTINLIQEDSESFIQSVSGMACRPGRNWVFKQLKKHFEFVYMPITQPDHEQFPVDWALPEAQTQLTRAIYIASRKRCDNPLLIEGIPQFQINVKNHGV